MTVLSKQTVANLRRALAQANSCWSKIQEAIEAGIPVDEEMARCQFLQRSLESMIKVYGRPQGNIPVS